MRGSGRSVHPCIRHRRKRFRSPRRPSVEPDRVRDGGRHRAQARRAGAGCVLRHGCVSAARGPRGRGGRPRRRGGPLGGVDRRTRPSRGGIAASAHACGRCDHLAARRLRRGAGGAGRLLLSRHGRGHRAPDLPGTARRPGGVHDLAAWVDGARGQTSGKRDRCGHRHAGAGAARASRRSDRQRRGLRVVAHRAGTERCHRRRAPAPTGTDSRARLADRHRLGFRRRVGRPRPRPGRRRTPPLPRLAGCRRRHRHRRDHADRVGTRVAANSPRTRADTVAS